MSRHHDRGQWATRLAPLAVSLTAALAGGCTTGGRTDGGVGAPCAEDGDCLVFDTLCNTMTGECAMICHPVLGPFCDDPTPNCVDLGRLSGGVANGTRVCSTLCDQNRDCEGGEQCVEGSWSCEPMTDSCAGNGACPAWTWCVSEEVTGLPGGACIGSCNFCDQGCSDPTLDCYLPSDHIEAVGVCLPACGPMAPSCPAGSSCLTSWTGASTCVPDCGPDCLDIDY